MTINLSGNKTVTGMEFFKNSNSGLQFLFTGAAAATTLTVNGNIENKSILTTGVRTINFNNANLLLRGDYSLVNTSGGTSILKLSSSAASAVGGNMTLNSLTQYAPAAVPDSGLKLNMNGGAVDMGGFNTFGSGIAELKGSSTASVITTSGSGKTFRVNQATDTIYAGNFTSSVAAGGWSIQKESTGALTLSGDNSGMTKGATAYTSATINGGKLIGGHNSAFGTSTLANVTVGALGTIGVANQANLGINNLTLTSGAKFFFDLTGAVGSTDTQLLVGGNQTGAVDVTVALAGLTNSGSSSYTLMSVTGTTAATNFTQGTLTSDYQWLSLGWSGKDLVGSVFTWGSGNITTTNSALVFTNSADKTQSGAISGSGGLTVTGAGTLTVSGANSYSGGTLLSAGALKGDTTSIQGTITNNSKTIFDTATNGTYAGVMSGTGTLAKSGAGTLTLTATNTYNGATTVSAGKLVVSGAITNSAVTVTNTGILGGSGTVGDLLIANGGKLAPGNSPGTLFAASATWTNGGSYDWEILDAIGTAGATNGWDLLDVAGTLSLTGLSNSSFTINLITLSDSTTPGPMANFNPSSNYSWMIARAANIGGFNASLFNLYTNSFSNAYSGSFGITNGLYEGDQALFLTYTSGSEPIPEPGTWGAAALLAGCAGFLRWRKRRRS